MTLQVAIAFVFGLVFVIALIALAVKFPHPTPFQYNVFRSVFALAGAGVAAMIPGFIDLDLSGKSGLLLRAGGALAVFVVLFFFNPARLRAHEAAIYDHQRQLLALPSGRHFEPEMRDSFLRVWHALMALDKAAEALWQHVSDANLAAFAERKVEAENVIGEAALFFSDTDYSHLEDALQAADFYLGGKTRLSNIRNGLVRSKDTRVTLAGPNEVDRFVDSQVRSQIQQNHQWLTQYRGVLRNIRSSFHKGLLHSLGVPGAA